MGDAGREDEHVASRERVVAVERLKQQFSFECVDRHGPRRVVNRQVPARCKSHHRKAEGTFLHKSPGSAAVLRQDFLVDHPLIVSQMVDENFAFNRSVHR